MSKELRPFPWINALVMLLCAVSTGVQLERGQIGHCVTLALLALLNGISIAIWANNPTREYRGTHR